MAIFATSQSLLLAFRGIHSGFWLRHFGPPFTPGEEEAAWGFLQSKFGKGNPVQSPELFPFLARRGHFFHLPAGSPPLGFSMESDPRSPGSIPAERPFDHLLFNFQPLPSGSLLAVFPTPAQAGQALEQWFKNEDFTLNQNRLVSTREGVFILRGKGYRILSEIEDLDARSWNPGKGILTPAKDLHIRGNLDFGKSRVGTISSNFFLRIDGHCSGLDVRAQTLVIQGNIGCCHLHCEDFGALENVVNSDVSCDGLLWIRGHVKNSRLFATRGIIVQGEVVDTHFHSSSFIELRGRVKRGEADFGARIALQKKGELDRAVYRQEEEIKNFNQKARNLKSLLEQQEKKKQVFWNDLEREQAHLRSFDLEETNEKIEIAGQRLEGLRKVRDFEQSIIFLYVKDPAAELKIPKAVQGLGPMQKPVSSIHFYTAGEIVT